MRYCPNCGHDLNDGVEKYGWTNCPYCRAPLGVTAPAPGSAPTPAPSAAPAATNNKTLILACSGVAIAAACILDWGEIIWLGSFKVWDLMQLTSELSQYSSSYSTYSTSSSSSLSGVAAVAVLTLIAAFVGMAITAYGMYRFSNAPQDADERRKLSSGLVVLGGSMLFWIVAIASVSAEINREIYNYTSYSTGVSVISVSSGPYVALIACVLAVFMLHKLNTQES